MNYYEHHLGDYAEATAHLSFVEDAAYSRLLRKCYATEAPLPADIKAVLRLVAARTKEEKEAVAAVLEEFFELHEDGWHNRRCDAEIAHYREKQSKARASAEARWSALRPHSERNANASTEPMRTHSDRNANGMPRVGAGGRVSSLQSPDTSLASEMQTADRRDAPDPPTPPPAFDGLNAEALNGKAVVPIAAGWQLPEAWGIDAEALGWIRIEVLHEAEKFRQHWTAGKGQGKRRSVKGWRQAWSNWLAIAAEKRR